MERKTGQMEGHKIKNIWKHRCQNPKLMRGIGGAHVKFQYDDIPIENKFE